MLTLKLLLHDTKKGTFIIQFKLNDEIMRIQIQRTMNVIFMENISLIRDSTCYYIWETMTYSKLLYIIESL